MDGDSDMARKKVATMEPLEQKEAFDFTPWIPTVFQLLDDSEIMTAAKVVGTALPGFGPRSLHKAPKSMLRKKTLEKLANMAVPIKFVASLYKPLLALVKEVEEPQALLWKMNQDGVSSAAKLAALGLERPDYFQTIEQIVADNVKEKKDPFDGLVKTPELDEQVRLHVPMNLGPTLERVAAIEGTLGKSVELTEGEALKQLKEHMYLNEVGTYVTFAAKSEEWKQWETKDREAFLQLVMLDAMNLVTYQHMEFDSHKDELQEANEKLEALGASKDEAEEEVLRLQERIAELEEQLKAQTKAKKDAEKDLEAAKQAAHTATQSAAKAAAEAKPLPVYEPILNDPRVKLVLFQERPDLSQYIYESSIVLLKSPKDVTTQIKKAGAESELLWFIESDRVSSKEMFQLEQTLRQNKAAFRFVSGGDAELIRKIIYNLEGDMNYEAH